MSTAISLLFLALVVWSELWRRRTVRARERGLERLAEALRADGLECVLVSRDLWRLPISAHFEAPGGGEEGYAHVSFHRRADMRVNGRWRPCGSRSMVTLPNSGPWPDSTPWPRLGRFR